ncbi:partial glycerol-3-phosphate acyltransferase PlsY, partial [uncultured bacterium]
MDRTTVYIVFITASYLLGSIPTGIVISRLMGKGDPRKSGSGNIGATNV